MSESDCVRTVLDWMESDTAAYVTVDDENRRPQFAIAGYASHGLLVAEYPLTHQYDELHQAIAAGPPIWENSTPDSGWNPIIRRERLYRYLGL